MLVVLQKLTYFYLKHKSIANLNQIAAMAAEAY